ncbi:MAG: hypothetical protein ACTS8R_05340 [Arsenophonus sp. NC-QC1-MAG3]
MAKYHDDYVPSPVSSSIPKIRSAIQDSRSVTSTLSERYSISELTVAKGKNQITSMRLELYSYRFLMTLSPAKKSVVIPCEKCFISLADFLASPYTNF